jgi:integrase
VKRHLTDAGISRFKVPASGQLEIFDLGYSGLALRVGYGGAKTFVLFYRFGGKLHRTTLGRWPSISLADARIAWRKTREAIAKGEDPSRIDGAPAMLFETVVEEWLRRDQSKNKASSLYQVTRAVEYNMLPAWRGKSVDAISKRDVIALLDSIADRGAPMQARRTAAHVNRFFQWCLERDILKASPTAGLSKPANGKSRERVLSNEELAKVWHASPGIGIFGSIVRLLLLTGMRREEATQLRWSEINDGYVTLQGDRTKTGVTHIIPLSDPAKTLLDNVPRIAGSDFVFTTTGEKPISGWSYGKGKLDAASGVDDWRIHDLRRTVATGMQKLGIGLQTVEACLGHTSGGSRSGIVGVYQRHDYAAEKRAALEAWANHIALLTGKVGTVGEMI